MNYITEITNIKRKLCCLANKLNALIPPPPQAPELFTFTGDGSQASKEMVITFNNTYDKPPIVAPINNLTNNTTYNYITEVTTTGVTLRASSSTHNTTIQIYEN